MQLFLPSEIWAMVYEFDGRHREQHAKCLAEMRRVMHLFQSFLLCGDPARFCRRHTKAELEQLCRYVHLKIPKHKTKEQMCLLLHGYVSCIVPGSFLPFGL